MPAGPQVLTLGADTDIMHALLEGGQARRCTLSSGQVVISEAVLLRSGGHSSTFQTPLMHSGTSCQQVYDSSMTERLHAAG